MIYLINILFEFLKIAILIRVALSWITHNRYNILINFIYQITDPILIPVRKVIKPIGGIDFSPIIIFILIGVLQTVVINFLLSI